MQGMADFETLRLSPNLHPEVILCIFMVFERTNGDELDSTGRIRVRTAFRDFRIPRDYSVSTTSADYDYALAA